ncbi:MAG: hypothetical protein CL878_09550 [Dehalococcoidia bacterium]|nr:hypothetical protein [Dehalococcoidia bacterium]
MWKALAQVWPFGRKRRPTTLMTADDYEARIRANRVKRQDMELSLANLCLQDPQMFELGVAMISRNAARAVEARRRSREQDPMLSLAHKMIEQQMLRSPHDEIKAYMQIAKLMKGVASGHSDEDDSIWTRLANSEAGAELARGLGESLPQLFGGVAQQWRDQQSGPSETANLDPTNAAPTPAGTSVVTPGALLALLEHGTPEGIAAQIMAWAETDQEAAGVVHVLLQTPDAEFARKLQPLLMAPGWNHVARWLLDHADKRRAIIVALSRSSAGKQAAPATSSQPAHAPPPAAPEPPQPTEPPPPGLEPAPVGANGGVNGPASAEDFGL